MLEEIKGNSQRAGTVRKLISCVEQQNDIILELTGKIEHLESTQKILINYLEDVESEIELIEQKIGMVA